MRFPLARFRYSLRALFVSTLLCSLASYWFALPSINAHRFLVAMTDKRFADADRLFKDSDQGFITGFGDVYQLRNAKVSVHPLTWSQLLRRERMLTVHLPYGKATMSWDIGVCASTGGLTIAFLNT
jgi:hypothetical protein